MSLSGLSLMLHAFRIRIALTAAGFFLALVLLAQIPLLLAWGSGPASYHHRELMAALVEWKRSHSPTAKAAFDAECARVIRHDKLATIAYRGAFFFVNGALLYLFWKYGIVRVRHLNGHPGGAEEEMAH
jgi:hypothetical protein